VPAEEGVRILALEQVVLDSPAFAAATPSLTSDDALVRFLTTLAGASRRLRLSSLGQSQQGRDLPLIYLTREGLDDPLAAVQRLQLSAKEKGLIAGGNAARLLRL